MAFLCSSSSFCSLADGIVNKVTVRPAKYLLSRSIDLLLGTPHLAVHR